MIFDDAARNRIRTDLENSYAVDAGAGTGKTRLLIDRLVQVLQEKPVALSRIAAITFTDKAAGELIERLRRELESRLQPGHPKEEAVRQALLDLEQAPISTIHSFCASILREYPVEAGVDPRFTVLDEVQAQALEDNHWKAWTRKTLAKKADPFFDFLKLGGSLNQVENLKNQLLKYRALLGRPAIPSLPSPQTLLRELEGLFLETPSLLNHCNVLTDAMAEQLVSFKRRYGALREKKPGEVELAAFGTPKPKAGNMVNWTSGTLKPLKARLEALEADREDFASKVKHRVLLSLEQWIWEYLDSYANAKKRQGLLDFDDLLSRTRDLLRDFPFTREQIKGRFDRLFVDEFQDTDPLQVEIVFFLCEAKGKNAGKWNEVELSPGKLFMVGDPQQSIYRFRRADVEIYRQAREKLRTCGGKVEELSENFRTLSPIVEWVNRAFKEIFQKGAFPYVPQAAFRPKAGDEKAVPCLLALTLPEVTGEKPGVEEFRKNEARTVAAFLEKLLAGNHTVEDAQSKKRRPLKPGDIAVLFRQLSNTEEPYEEAFRQRNIPYHIVGGKRFYHRPEIVALETLLLALESPADEAALVAALRSQLFGVTDEQLFLHRSSGGAFQFLKETTGPLTEAFAKLRQWRERVRSAAPSEALLRLFEATNLLAVVAAQPHGQQRVANLLKVADQCRKLESSQNFTYRAFAKWLSRQREEETMEGEAPGPEEATDQITLMTLHKAKGLEFPVAVLSGAASQGARSEDFILESGRGRAQFKAGVKEQGLWTLGYSDAVALEKEQEAAENLRLLYVGCTRAKDCLVLPFSKQEKGAPFLKPLLAHIETMPAASLDGAARTEAELPALAVDLSREKKKGEAVETAQAEWEKILAAKKEAAEELKGKPALVSVSELVHSDDDKSWREDSSKMEDRESWRIQGQESAKKFGVLVHQLMEKGWNWDKPRLEKAARLRALDLNLSQEEARNAAELAQKALSYGLLSRAKQSRHVFRELPLCGKDAEGRLLNAIIDLAFLENDQWVIVDYKTDRNPEENLENYRRQLGFYRLLLESITKKSVKEAGILFLREPDSPKNWVLI
jgi:ATP-dependent helicase/nuclease subunit A